VFVVVLLIVFRREFMAARPKLVRHRPDTTTHQAIAGTLAVTEAVQPVQPLHQSRKDAVVVVLSRQIDRPNFSIIRPLLALLLMTVVGLMRSVSWVERLLHRTGSQLFAASKRCTTLGYQLGKRVWRQLYRTTVRGTVVIVRILVTLWKLGEPHFRAFDRYLDELLHANKYSAEALKAISGTSKTVSDAYQKAHKTTRKLLETK